MFSDSDFVVTGPSVWNALPWYVRKSPTLPVFQERLKTYLFQKVCPNNHRYSAFSEIFSLGCFRNYCIIFILVVIVLCIVVLIIIAIIIVIIVQDGEIRIQLPAHTTSCP